MQITNVLNAKISLRLNKAFVWSQMESISVSKRILRTDQFVCSAITDTP